MGGTTGLRGQKVRPRYQTIASTMASRITRVVGDFPFLASIHSRLRRRRTRMSDMVLDLFFDGQ